MKLYTEEQVIQMLKAREAGLSVDYILLVNEPIELPTDEEIEEAAEEYADCYISSTVFSFDDGAKWMRDKIEGGNK